ncbi:MAG TPA: hypothetical protein VHJ76_04475, partial [Actinomycetota bacterium]|nr:hypothetical protein [Actinomycetota bacterium]
NIAIYQDEGATESLFQGEQITASTTTYEIHGPKPGEYYFQCDVHPDMNGTAVSEEASGGGEGGGAGGGAGEGGEEAPEEPAE